MITVELRKLLRELEFAAFAHAHICGAIELYAEWVLNRGKNIGRQYTREGKVIARYTALPPMAIARQQNNLQGFVCAAVQSRMVADFDHYLASVLKNRFATESRSGNSWNRFCQVTRIDLVGLPEGQTVYKLVQERHKVEHTQARIDSLFIDRLSAKGISDSRQVGDKIRKRLDDPLRVCESIRRLAVNVDEKVIRITGANDNVDEGPVDFWDVTFL